MHAPWPLPSLFSFTWGRKGKGARWKRGDDEVDLSPHALRARVVLTCPFQYSSTSYRVSSQVMSHPVAPRRGHALSPCLPRSPSSALPPALILLRRNFRCACATTRPARSCVKARARCPARHYATQDVIYYVAQRLGVKNRRGGVGTDCGVTSVLFKEKLEE